MVGSVAFRFSDGLAAYDLVHSRENVFNIECAMFMFMYLASMPLVGFPSTSKSQHLVYLWIS